MDVDEYKRFLNLQKFVIVFFYNKHFSSLIKKIDKLKKDCENRNMFNVFLYIDVDSNKEIVENLFLKSVPLFRIYHNSEMIEEIFGNYNNITEILNTYL